MPDIEQENEAYTALKQFIEKEFKNFNYTIVVGLARTEGDKDIYSMGFTLSNITAFTPIGIVKGTYANMMAQYHHVMSKYDIEPAKPLIQQKGGKEDE